MPDTLGLATVSISAVVSPKSLMKSIGRAPLGRPVMVSSFNLMSSNSLAVSLIPSSSSMVTTATPPRVLDSIFLIRELSIFSSIGRVMYSSIFSALAPGHIAIAAATRT